ncbi:hypothetical protein C2845_PM12G12490 [Panicum miliaceum]|uniref:RNase H type-1 domain-containing protein n=1 Tax=Panicum miliaceum TaxID=4540 RepID=A0A3L6QEI7_PANMI|nr:hypothetical protein C2845_PM12G12490 [Panicum miliaceum]
MRNADDLAFAIQQKSAEEFLNMNRKKEAKVAGPNPAWSKPPRDFLKINSDSSFSAITGQGGWGFVIRDDEGSVIHAAAGKLERLRDALQAEVIACSEGAKAAAEKRICKVIFETDSLILKQAMADDSIS